MPGPQDHAQEPSSAAQDLTSQGLGQWPQRSPHPVSPGGEARLGGTPQWALPTGAHQRDEVGESEGQVDIHNFIDGDDREHLLVIALLLEEVVDEPLLLVHTEPTWEVGQANQEGLRRVLGPVPPHRDAR